MPGYSAGGPQASLDQYTYESTLDHPYTITLTDLTTHEVLWTVDVPIGKELVVQFFDDYNPSNKARPALMKWRIFDLGTEFGELTSTMPAPVGSSRLLDVAIRKPQDAMPAMAPMPPKAVPVLPPPESAPAAGTPH